MIYIYYLIIVELIVASVLQFSTKYCHAAKNIYWINIIALIIFSSLKDPNLTADGLTYLRALNGQEIILEPTFNIIAQIINNSLNGHYVWLFFLYSTIAIITKSIAIVNLSEYCLICLLVWIADFFPLHELGQIRVAAASGFFLLSIDSLYKRELRKYLLWTFLATIFHFSAILMLGLWFLKSNNINLTIWYALTLLSFLWAILRFDILQLVSLIPIEGISAKYEAYKTIQDSHSEASILSPLIVGKLLIIVFITWKTKIIEKRSRYAILLSKIMLISIIARSILATNVSVAFRVSEFFGVVEIVYIPYIMYILKQKYLAYSIIILIVLVFSSIRIFSNRLILF